MMWWIQDSNPDLLDQKFFLLHSQLRAGRREGWKEWRSFCGELEKKGCMGKLTRKRRVTWENDERLEPKWDGIKQVYLWLLLLPVASCFLTFSNLFIAKKSADCFNIAIIVVARVSWISWAWGALGFSGRKLYYKQRK